MLAMMVAVALMPDRREASVASISSRTLYDTPPVWVVTADGATRVTLAGQCRIGQRADDHLYRLAGLDGGNIDFIYQHVQVEPCRLGQPHGRLAHRGGAAHDNRHRRDHAVPRRHQGGVLEAALCLLHSQLGLLDSRPGYFHLAGRRPALQPVQAGLRLPQLGLRASDLRLRGCHLGRVTDSVRRYWAPPSAGQSWHSGHRLRQHAQYRRSLTLPYACCALELDGLVHLRLRCGHAIGPLSVRW